MAIIQISRIQHRSGNLVDLPQLSEAELGWATDEKRLFVGKTSPNENIEILTSYSNVNFSQIVGSEGNINITGATDGQVLTYDGNNWVNRGSAGGGEINLGAVSNVTISGGATGYVLQTDGTGNLSWAPKGTLYTTVTNLTNNPSGNVITMTVLDTHGNATVPYVNGQAVTISGGNISNSGANSNINGHTFYLKLATNYATSGNVTLYTDTGLTVSANGAGLTSYTANSGIATAVLSTGGGGGSAGGANTQVQFNNNNIPDGNSGFTYDYIAGLLTLSGNANVGNLNATGVITSSRLVSNVATGTTPLIITSTTRVANLNVSYANVSDYEVITAQNTGTFYPAFVNGSATANYALGANANLSFNAATGALAATLLTGTLTTAAQPNVTSVGTLSGLVVSGHITPSANITYNLGNNTNRFNDLWLANSTIYIGAQTISANSTSVIISGNVVGNMSGNATTAGTVTTAAQPNITSVGTLTSLAVTGNISGANLTGTHYGAATGLTSIPGGNVTGQVPNALVAGTVYTAAQPNITSVGTLVNLYVNAAVNATSFTSNVATGTAPFIVTSTTQVANLSVATAGLATFATTANAVAGANVSGAVAFATTANAVAGANVSGQVANALVAGTVYTAAQPNITSVGTLTSLTTTVITSGATATAGTITGNWSLGAGSKLNATYADLAECYEADADYEPGTVLEFGGVHEVTVASDATNRVAGVVSTAPAYVMNSSCKGEHVVVIALQGRTPCKVRGIIRKGDMLISGGDGFARPSSNPLMGSVIGKSLENFDGVSGVIEIAVSRL